MTLMYLDYNCFQRCFDDPNQVKIQMEALACEEIFSRAEKKAVTLAWSFMHEDENILCPFPERKIETSRLASLCNERIGPDAKILLYAAEFQKKARLSSKDALHLAAAQYAGCEYFLTCDDELVARSKRLALEIKIMNPVDYIRQG